MAMSEAHAVTKPSRDVSSELVHFCLLLLAQTDHTGGGDELFLYGKNSHLTDSVDVGRGEELGPLPSSTGGSSHGCAKSDMFTFLDGIHAKLRKCIHWFIQHSNLLVESKCGQDLGFLALSTAGKGEIRNCPGLLEIERMHLISGGFCLEKIKTTVTSRATSAFK